MRLNQAAVNLDQSTFTSIEVRLHIQTFNWSNSFCSEETLLHTWGEHIQYEDRQREGIGHLDREQMKAIGFRVRSEIPRFYPRFYTLRQSKLLKSKLLLGQSDLKRPPLWWGLRALALRDAQLKLEVQISELQGA